MQQNLITEEEIKTLKEYNPDIEEIAKLNDIDELEIAIMIAIDKTLDSEDEATDETYILEEIYDKVSSRYHKLKK